MVVTGQALGKAGRWSGTHRLLPDDRDLVPLASPGENGGSTGPSL